MLTVPSWNNERKRSSSVNTTIWSAVVIACLCVCVFRVSMLCKKIGSLIIYVSIGILGAYAFPNLNGAGLCCCFSLSFCFIFVKDILTALNRQHATIFDQITVYLFPIIVVASGIPVYSIIVR